MALKVNEIVRVTVEASDGQVLKEGDAILLRVSRRTPEDIICRYTGLSNGYFVTTTLDGQTENKYRQSSIETCYRIKEPEKIPPQVLEEAGKDAGAEAGKEAAALMQPGA